MDRLVCMTVDSASGQKRQKGKSAREALLDAAFDEMYLHGFRAAGIEVILATSGVSKGALYHNFGNKQGLESSDPTEALRRMGQRMEEELLKTGILQRGCPVNNLVQEMSGVDDGFRQRLSAILQEWRDTIADGLRRGQAAGTVNQEANPEEAGTFIVACLMGAVGFAKNAGDVMPFDLCRRVLDTYVETLRPKAAASAG
jgi:AcrR family transcriptional regulator